MPSWKIDIPNMFHNMIDDIAESSLPFGGLFNSASVGGSVARANDAKASMSRFTQSICTALIGDSL